MQQLVTDKKTVRLALSQWFDAFVEIGSEVVKNKKSKYVIHDGCCLVNGTWMRGRSRRNWYGLTDSCERSVGKAVVQVNIADGGFAGRYQGIATRDNKGRLWILHRGEMNVSDKRIKLSEYDHIHRMKRFYVEFKPGIRIICYPVACIDDSPAKIVMQTRKFLEGCRSVRNFVLSELFSELSPLKKLEALDENTDPYTIKPQSAKTIEKKHAEIVNALIRFMKSEGYQVANTRKDGLGPDLYTIGANPLLIEVKTTYRSNDYLKAVGQLYFYESILGNNYCKIFLAPANVPENLVNSLCSLKIKTATFEKKGQKYNFYGI